MTVDGIRERLSLFNQYDHAMQKLVGELEAFQDESKLVVKENSDPIRLYGLAFNLAWTLRNSIELCQKYDDEVRYSLLYERYEMNKSLSDLMEECKDRIVPFLENLIGRWPVSINEYTVYDIVNEVKGEDADTLLADNKYLSELSKDLASNGNKILHIVCYYLRHISRQLINIKTVRANMTENDYRFLFERELNDYLSTDKWEELKNGYIDWQIKYAFHGNEPTKEQLAELLYSELDKIEQIPGFFSEIKLYLENWSKLARMIVMREFDNIIKTPLLDLFQRIGYKKVIEEWIDQLEQEELCYIPEDPDESEIEYSEKFSESVSTRVIPQIMNLYQGKDAMDWVCFFHVLVFYSYMSCSDFNAFNRWLTNVTGKVLISTGNARKIKMSYWAKNAKIKWTKEGALNVTNTTQQETKFRHYIQLCNDIRDIINEARN